MSKGFDIMFHPSAHDVTEEEPSAPCQEHTFLSNDESFILNGTWFFSAVVGNPAGSLSLSLFGNTNDTVFSPPADFGRILQNGDTIEFDYRYLNTELEITSDWLKAQCDTVESGTIINVSIPADKSADTGWLHFSTSIPAINDGETLDNWRIVAQGVVFTSPTAAFYFDNTTVGQDC